MNTTDFTLALKKGLGQARIYIQQHGIEEVEDIVLDACLHNQAYHPQLESVNGGRAAWLYAMFQHSAAQPRFRTAILSALATETDYDDLQQVFELAQELAVYGDRKARQQVRTRALQIAQQPSNLYDLGADTWVALGGADAVLELARLYGKRLQRDPDDFVNDGLLLDNEGEVQEAYKATLIEHVQHAPEIQTYWKYLQARNRVSTVRLQVRITATLETTLTNARNGQGEFPGAYRVFGEIATQQEREIVYETLLQTTDTATRIRLLWVFRGGPLPRLDPVIFDWTQGADGALAEAAIGALSQSTDERIHALARHKIQSGAILPENSAVLDLFINNYANGDGVRITQALASLSPDEDETYDLGLSLLDIAERHHDAALGPALAWLYERTPCTNCRYETVVHLHKLGQLEAAVLEECRFDANADIREFARACSMPRDKIFRQFSSHVFSSPLYYASPGGLRFELATGDTVVDRFLSALQRAEEITGALFEGCDWITVCIDFHGSKSFVSCLKQYRGLRSLGVTVPRGAEHWSEKVPSQDEWSQDEPAVYRHFLLFPLQRSQLRLVLWGALAREIGIRPRLQGGLYLFNVKVGLVAHPYDDRGMAVVGPNAARLRELYQEFSPYLLDADRPEMDGIHGVH